jgi:hypothetical protein
MVITGTVYGVVEQLIAYCTVASETLLCYFVS